MDLSSFPFHQFPSNFVYQRRARSELYLSRTGYRVFDCRESRCPPRSPLSPALYHFTAISGIILRPWTTTTVSREREKFDGIGSCLKQHVAKTEREREREKREKPMRLVLFGNLLVSHCEEFTWPGSRFVELCNRLDSSRLFFSGRTQITFTTSFLLARKRTIDDIIDNKRRLRARKIEREIALFAKAALQSRSPRQCSLRHELNEREGELLGRIPLVSLTVLGHSEFTWLSNPFYKEGFHRDTITAKYSSSTSSIDTVQNI